MTSGLLRAVSFTVLGVLAAMMVAFVAHGVWMDMGARARRRQVGRLRQGIAALMGDPEALTTDWHPDRSRLYQQALNELAPSVSGATADWVEQEARSAGLTDAAARQCRAHRWWHRLRGVRQFELLGGGADIVPALLEDRHPLVRCAAVAWVMRHPTPALIARLVAMLDDPHRRCRFVAQDALVRLGRPVSQPLADYLATSRTPGRVLALGVAVGLGDPRFLQPALAAAADPEPAVRTLGAALLAAVTGPAPERALISLLEDPSDPVRMAAARGLGLLGSWKFAPRLAPLLRDPAWDVQREAALTLLRLGPAGLLYLRRELDGPNRSAADMARQVLDLPNRSSVR